MPTWLGEPPKECNLCYEPITTTFIDGRTNLGPWASMCPKCHKAHGVGLGTGKGQRYQLVQGKWQKVEG